MGIEKGRNFVGNVEMKIYRNRGNVKRVKILKIKAKRRFLPFCIKWFSFKTSRRIDLRVGAMTSSQFPPMKSLPAKKRVNVIIYVFNLYSPGFSFLFHFFFPHWSCTYEQLLLEIFFCQSFFQRIEGCDLHKPQYTSGLIYINLMTLLYIGIKVLVRIEYISTAFFICIGLTRPKLWEWGRLR